MSISFDKALGIHQYTVGLRSKRAETIASNIANVNPQVIKQRIWISVEHCRRQVLVSRQVLHKPMGGIFLPHMQVLVELLEHKSFEFRPNLIPGMVILLIRNLSKICLCKMR